MHSLPCSERWRFKRRGELIKLICKCSPTSHCLPTVLIKPNGNEFIYTVYVQYSMLIQFYIGCSQSFFKSVFLSEHCHQINSHSQKIIANNEWSMNQKQHNHLSLTRSNKQKTLFICKTIRVSSCLKKLW